MAIAAALQTAASATSFSGTFVDDNQLQAKIMKRDNVDEATASERVDRRRTFQRVMLIVGWAASIVFDGLAIWILLAS